MIKINGGVCAAKGFIASGVGIGIKSTPPNMPRESTPAKKDLAIIYCEKKCNTAALYTQNKVKAAPILVTMGHLADNQAQAVVVNSGNANACTANSMEIAEPMCELTAKSLGISKEDVIVASTGVIGQPLTIEPFEKGIPALSEALSQSGSSQAAEAIMTTDTFPKEFAVEFELDGVTCKIGGITKGSGMIHPNMDTCAEDTCAEATMLAFITTDVNISAELLQKALRETNLKTFNMISVDGDTSTNDMVCIMASGLAGNAEIVCESSNYERFCAALYTVMEDLAKQIARDGEGATKLIECTVRGAADELTAKSVAKTVISSSLVKAALGAADANWGRILCAIGYSDGRFTVDNVQLTISSSKGEVVVCKGGAGVEFCEEKAFEILSEDEVTIIIDLHSGTASATAWGCDLTEEYVKINADYRS